MEQGLFTWQFWAGQCIGLVLAVVGGTRWLALGSVSGAIASRRCRDWVKIKNIAHPAIERAMLIALSNRRRPH
jgi:hypothetical protein